MTDRDAADAVMDAACSPDFIHGKHMHGIGGASQNRDCKHCAAVRAAVEQAIVDARIEEHKMACPMPSDQWCPRTAELERQRGAQ